MEPAEQEERGTQFSAKELYKLYGASLVPVISVNDAGDEGIGSAFHVGGGSFVTARHVVEGMVSCCVEVDDYRLMRLAGDAVRDIKPGQAAIPIDPRMHPDPDKDVAVFSIPSLASLPAIPLGGHLDDWITDHDFVLNEVLVLGFPPIPLSNKNVLFATRAQINAVVDLINVDHVHFIASAMARGGFSGGVVLSEWGFALGVVTTSLLKNGAPEELGYLTVLTVEPILECLGVNELLPVDLALEWDGLFTAKTEEFGAPEKGWAHSRITTDRDGHRARISFSTPDEVALTKMVDVVSSLSEFEDATEPGAEGTRVWKFRGNYSDSEEALERARNALCTVLAAHGYSLVNHPILYTNSLDVPSSLCGLPDGGQENSGTAG